MTEEEKVVNSENVAQTSDSQQASGAPASTEVKIETPKEGSKEFNFRRLEKRLEEQERINQELLAEKQSRLASQQKQEEVLPALNPDDIPEWQHVQKYMDKVTERKIQEALEKKERAELPKIVKQKYSDFDDIVTNERVKQLEMENPDLARAFSLSNDPFSTTYNYFKVLYAQKKKDPVAMEEAEKILENSNKPISSNAIGRQGALKNANSFAKKSKEQLYKEMMDAASRVNNN